MNGNSMQESGVPFAFNDENLAEAKKIIAKYPEGRQQSAVMPLLDVAQRQNGGWLTRETMDYVADMLSMPPIAVYEVATFYTMYNHKPVGRFHVQVCTNLPCWLRGSDGIAAACKKATGLEWGQSDADGVFTLSEVECLGACVNAPMMQINDDYYEDLTPESAEAVLTALKNGETPKVGPQNARRSCEPVTGLTSLTGDSTNKEEGA
ncbi:MAG: NADH-quinone oxidoreductase subunit NuoE [Rhodospirillales bacterium]